MNFYHKQMYKRALWLVRIRWFYIIFVTLAIAISIHVLNIPLFTLPLFILLCILFVYNSLIYYILQKVSTSQRYTLNLGLIRFQLAADFVLLTVFLHFSGGVENPFAFYFVFHVIIGSFLLERVQAFIYTTLGVCLFLLTVILEYSGVIEHYCLIHTQNLSLHTNFTYIFSFLFAFTTAMYIATFHATTLAKIMKQRDVELEKANQALARQDRVKSEYILMLSHDLQEPMATVQNSIQLVLSGYCGKVNSMSKEVLERAGLWTTRMIQYVRDLLDLSHLKVDQHKDMERVLLNRELSKLIKQFDRDIQKKSLSLKVEVTDHELWINGNLPDLEHLFKNLISNAIKYTPTGRKIGVRLFKKENKACLQVWDTGIGIPSEHQEEIFEEFYRTPQAVKFDKHGTGLGMSIIKHIVDNHKATISVTSPYIENKGTCFEILFPLLQDHKIKPESTTKNNENIKKESADMSKDKKILIIDDNPDLIANTKVVLEANGYKVFGATDGDEGLELLRKVHPDLIILDIMMKSQTEGFHIAYKLRSTDSKSEFKEFSNVPILIMSSIHRKTDIKFDDTVGTEWLPADSFLDKPVDPDVLLERVEKLIRVAQSSG